MQINSDRDIFTVELSGALDESQGEALETAVREKVPRGGKLVIDGTGLTTISQQGLFHLLTVQRWAATADRKKLVLAKFPAAVWQFIVNDGADKVMDSKPTLADAQAVFGGGDDYPTRQTSAAGEEDEGPWQRGGSAGPSGPRPSGPRPSGPNPPPVFPGPVPGGKPSVLPWIIGGAVLLLVLAGAGAWWLLANRPPEIVVPVASVTVEEEGKEVDEILVDVRRGTLVQSSWDGLPRGLYFDPPPDNASSTYALRGKAERGATTSTVQLEATSGSGKTSKPVAFTVEVKEKPLSWQLNTLQSLGLSAGSPIKARSKFVAGAENVTAEGLPAGLRVERVPGLDKDWQLGGTPAAAGKAEVTFKASAAGRGPETKTWTLDVAPASPASASAPVPAPTLPGSETRGAPPQPAPASTSANVDDGLRKFLLERIEKLPSRYTDEDRENLRLIVNGLKQARLILRVPFERDGQVEVSADIAARLKAALQSPENAALLKEAGCQTVIVGYASKTGRLATNVRVSKLRARAVDDLVKNATGHNADLCGDYGPTDIVDPGADQTNRVVEVYAGTMDVPPYLRGRAESFKQDFNRRHGVR